jgi:hypothetical protein
MLVTKGIASADALRHVLSNEPQPRSLDRLGAPRCRIYQPSASVMQSGGRTNGKWLLEFEAGIATLDRAADGLDGIGRSVRIGAPHHCDAERRDRLLRGHRFHPHGGSLGLFPSREGRSRPTYAANPIH